jgi:hypothetical protein
LSDKDFKVKNKLQVAGITSAGPLVSDASGNVDSTSSIATQYGGTGTTTSPTSGQILYSSAGTTYSATTLTDLVIGSKYQSSEPTSPVTGQVWIDSDSSAPAFDPTLVRRQTFTATAGQTVFTVTNSFTDGTESVYLNGILLVRTSDYTTSNSNTITLLSAAAVNDIIEVIGITLISPTNTYTQAEINSAILIAVPSQTGNSGKYLTTNGSTSSWGTIDLSSYLTSSTAASTYLTQSNATSTYLTQSNAGSTYATIARVNDIEIASIMGAY